MKTKILQASYLDGREKLEGLVAKFMEQGWRVHTFTSTPGPEDIYYTVFLVHYGQTLIDY